MTLDEDVKEIFRKFDERKRNKQKEKSELKNSSQYNPRDAYMGQPERAFKKKS